MVDHTNRLSESCIREVDEAARAALEAIGEQKPVCNLSSHTEKLEFYLQSAFSLKTYNSYRSDYKDFVSWAGAKFPFPSTVVEIQRYLVDRAEEFAPSTLSHRVAALSYIHRLLGHHDPTKELDVLNLLSGIKNARARNGWSPKPAQNITYEELFAILSSMDDSKLALRDRTIILLGVFGGARQSELIGITLEDILWHSLGALIKIDAPHMSNYLIIPRVRAVINVNRWHGLDKATITKLCPASTLEAYINSCGLTKGPLLHGMTRNHDIMQGRISKTTIGRALQGRARVAGLASANKITMQSLRVSFDFALNATKANEAFLGRQATQDNLNPYIFTRPRSLLFLESLLSEATKRF